MNAYFLKYNMTEENSGLIAATVLDPRFKRLQFLPDNSDKAAYYKFAAEAIDRSCPKPNNSTNTDLVVKKIEETKENFLDFDGHDDNPLVFKTTLQEIKKYVSFKNSPPKEFYEEFGTTFPRLSVAPQYFLVSPGTSVPVERVFSHASFQVVFICFDDNLNRNFINILKKVSSRRNKLSGDSLEDIIFLFENANIENDDDDDFNTEY